MALFADLTFQRLDPLVGGRAGPHASVAVGLPNPVAPSLAPAADLNGNRAVRRKLRSCACLDGQNHPYSGLTDLC